MNLTPSVKKDNVQILTNNKFLFLDMKMSWYPKGELQFGVFRKNVQQLKYVDTVSNHTPDTLHTIPSGVLNWLAKITSRKPSFQYERVNNVYPDHVNSLRLAVL